MKADLTATDSSINKLESLWNYLILFFKNKITPYQKISAWPLDMLKQINQEKQ